MFFPKCGNKLPDDADFCTQCGEKLTRETAPSTGTPQPADSGKAAAPKEKKPKKKKAKKVAIGIVTVVAVVLVGGAISDDNSQDTPTLFDLAEGVAPMTEYGYDATYGDVLDWLIAGEKISLKQEGSVAYLTYSGNVTGGDHPVSVVLEMTGLSADAEEQRLYPCAMTLNGIIVDDWLAAHPIGPMSGSAPRDGSSIPEEVAQAHYSFELWAAPREHLGLIYVRKIDGYLAFTPFHGGTIYDLDAWYEATYGAYSP